MLPSVSPKIGPTSTPGPDRRKVEAGLARMVKRPTAAQWKLAEREAEAYRAKLRQVLAGWRRDKHGGALKAWPVVYGPREAAFNPGPFPELSPSGNERFGRIRAPRASAR